MQYARGNILKAPDYWLDLPGHAPPDFHGTVERRAVGPLSLWNIEGQQHRVRRTAAPAGGADEAWLFVAIQRRGGCVLRQRGEQASLSPGDLAVYSSALPYELEFDGAFRQTTVMMPARQLRALCPAIDTLTATTLNGAQPQVALLGMMADCYFDTGYAHLPEQTAAHAAGALCHAMAACAMTLLGALEARRSNMSQYHMDRIQQFALSRLGDNTLSIAHVVEALDISAAHIHRLYAAEAQTFSAWLWDMRIQLCHMALSNPALSGLSISQIAFKFGFNHAAHFSRVYRARYGMTPSARRGGSRQQPQPQQPPRPAAGAAGPA
jgi:AraC-like DNA-binding protein